MQFALLIVGTASLIALIMVLISLHLLMERVDILEIRGKNNKIYLTERVDVGNGIHVCRFGSFDVDEVLQKLVHHLGLRMIIDPARDQSIRFEENE